MASAVRCAVLAAAALVVAGGSEHGGDGLRAVGDPAEVCVPAGRDLLATVSLDRLKNVTDVDVVITDVSLVGSTGLDVAGWYTVPGDGPVPGVVPGFTPPPAPETVVPVDQEATLVLGLKVDGEEGRAHAAEVTYTVGSSSPDVVRTVIAQRVVAGGSSACF